jgi:hypothetical protein
MSDQQLADILQSHWNLLWPLAPAERVRQINELRADYEYERDLERVAAEMEAVQ